MRAGENNESGGRAAPIRQRVEDNAVLPRWIVFSDQRFAVAKDDRERVRRKRKHHIRILRYLTLKKLRRAAGDARLRRSTEFLLSFCYVNVQLACFKRSLL